jgi:DnaJ-class molecular chaperone
VSAFNGIYAPAARCIECNGDGEVPHPRPEHAESPTVECDHCGGDGECGCDDCVNTASENAFSDMCESEPPMTMREQQELAQRQREELRR